MGKKTAKAGEKGLKNLKPKANDVKGGRESARSQAEKRLSDHRNEMRRNWAP